MYVHFEWRCMSTFTDEGQGGGCLITQLWWRGGGGGSNGVELLFIVLAAVMPGYQGSESTLIYSLLTATVVYSTVELRKKEKKPQTYRKSPSIAVLTFERPVFDYSVWYNINRLFITLMLWIFTWNLKNTKHAIIWSFEIKKSTFRWGSNERTGKLLLLKWI